MQWAFIAALLPDDRKAVVAWSTSMARTVYTGVNMCKYIIDMPPLPRAVASHRLKQIWKKKLTTTKLTAVCNNNIELSFTRSTSTCFTSLDHTVSFYHLRRKPHARCKEVVRIWRQRNAVVFPAYIHNRMIDILAANTGSDYCMDEKAMNAVWKRHQWAFTTFNSGCLWHLYRN